MNPPFGIRSLILLLGIAAAPFVPTFAAEQPNFLVIVADDLGFSDLGCYGGEINTPNLDRLAGQGTRFTRFYTTSRCCPSRAALLTGQYPHAVGLGHMTQDLQRPGYRGRVTPGVPTIAEVLEPLGYQSYLAGKWHLGTDDPTAHGFLEFYGTLVSAKTFWDPDHFTRLPADRKRIEYPADKFYATDAVTDHALQFLEIAQSNPDQPWFLYLAYNAPHFPLQAPQEDIARYADRYHDGWDVIREERLARMKELGILPPETPLTARSPYANYGETETGINPAWTDLPEDRRADLARRMAIYAAMIDRMDQQIGRVVEQLEQSDQLNNTVIVFLSDNGACAEWDPHGFDISSSPNNILHRGDELDQMGTPGTFHSVGSGWANASNTPFRMYKHYVHEGGITSPCIVFDPRNHTDGGQISDIPLHLIDLLPTLVTAAGGTVDDRYPGQSLQKYVKSTNVERPLFFEHEGNRAIHAGRWKLVAFRDRPWELYDMQRDRVEQNNLIRAHPEIAADLHQQWNTWAEANQVTPLPEDYEVQYLRSH
ncbi:arylsulfatase [Rubinisphaera margarita]|uniref:arylsulfatase n=1 Tax=Rubinisphaera margarita TaxID=2909586 RepID=UPI001EE7D511|nr:arylsulfatase [Rubinisphaera margarita]MCG6155177.1 arylsulfatase [Rubinisphaera margarita]